MAFDAMKHGRIPCIVPFCGCTADARKFPGDTEIICAKHWRLVSAETKARYRTVKRRKRNLWRIITDPRAARKPGKSIYYRAQDAVQKCWAQIKREAIERAAGI